MKVLLIFHSNEHPGSGLVVNVKVKALREKVITLLESNKDREAFDLIKRKGEPEIFLEPGQSPPQPLVTLIEDELC